MDGSDALPRLREELHIVPGAPFADGAPSWTLIDPVRNRYFAIGAEELSMLGAWSAGTISALRARLRSEADPTFGDRLERLLAFLYAQALTQRPVTSPSAHFEAMAQRYHRPVWQLLVHHYLFVKVPLVRPDRFLRASAPYLQFAFGRGFWLAIAVTTLLGLYLLSREWSAFASTFLHFLSPAGIAGYLATLIIVKAVHELAHAYTATHFGCRVATMGVAFLVMMPVLYTDTSDAWRLRERRQRLAIDAAGVLAELAIAGVATFVWCLAPEGFLKSVAFFVATTSWLTSVLVNLNPFMRFDGYYFLSDVVDEPNLQPRAFEVGRWALRERLFSIGASPPEALSNARRRAFAVYAWLTWAYRFVLFISIALLVYHLFFKALGVLLFVVEVIWFIAKPIANELHIWWTMRSTITRRSRSYVTLSFVALLVCLCIIPWSTNVSIPAVVTATVDERVHPPEAGLLKRSYVVDGQFVQRGEPLFDIDAPALGIAARRVAREIDLLRTRLNTQAADIATREYAQVLRHELSSKEQQAHGIAQRVAALKVVATTDGQVRDLASHLHP
ncbi:MAG: peptidase M50, partial [Gammaproteobacteria bacterium]|nr:peptidase M50 [Gammaproteobacteria bacterium]